MLTDEETQALGCARSVLQGKLRIDAPTTARLLSVIERVFSDLGVAREKIALTELEPQNGRETEDELDEGQSPTADGDF